MKKNDWKKREGIVYSTDDSFEYQENAQEVTATLPPEEQKLKVKLDTASRKGKTVTLIQGFVGTAEDLESLSKILKNKCSVGGSSKDNEIILQGDVRTKVMDILTTLKYKVK
ncbi:MAG: translation initiation factor [Cytophagaceae bacterium]|jgi:translation initiation factor 1|nr:translation initiation factor [Cytophagaceae bacterium]